jgi:hypothetical protein
MPNHQPATSSLRTCNEEKTQEHAGARPAATSVCAYSTLVTAPV